MTGSRPANLLRRFAEPATDRDLLARFVGARDDAAFAELVRRHGPVVLAACRRGTRGHHDAEDAFQAVFLILARRASSIGQPELLVNWLYQVAVRVARDARRAAARRRVHEVQGVTAPEPAVVPAEPLHDLGAVLDEELGRLPACYRDAVVLCDLRGLPRADAAGVLGIPPGTLASRLDAGRKKLATLLSRRGVALSVGAVLAAGQAVAVPESLSCKTCGLVAAWAAGSAVPAAVLHLVQGGAQMRRAVLLGMVSLVASTAVGVGLSARPQGGAAPQPPGPNTKALVPLADKKTAREPAERLAPQGQPVVVEMPHGRVEVLYYESAHGMRIAVKTGATEVQGRRVHIGDGKVAVMFQADGKGWDSPDGRVNRARVDYAPGTTVRVPADRLKKWGAVGGEVYVLTPGLTFEVVK